MEGAVSDRLRTVAAPSPEEASAEPPARVPRYRKKQVRRDSGGSVVLIETEQPPTCTRSPQEPSDQSSADPPLSAKQQRLLHPQVGSAVEVKDGAARHSGFSRGQKDNRCRHFLGSHDPPERTFRAPLLAELTSEVLSSHVRLD